MGRMRSSSPARDITPSSTPIRTVGPWQPERPREETMRSPQPRPAALLKGQDWEFLPAVLEIEEAPPSPVGRTVTWTIIAVFTVAVLWAAFSTVDIIAVAQGKIIPNDYSKVIQPLESGVVSAIHVQNGQEVHQGQVLIALDATAPSADYERLVNEHQAASVEIARLRA